MRYPNVDLLNLPDTPLQSMLDELYATIPRRVAEVRSAAADQRGCAIQDVDVAVEPSRDGLSINIVARPVIGGVVPMYPWWRKW